METEKLYSPLNFYLRDKADAEAGLYDETDYWRDTLSHEDAFGYMNSIELALRRDRDSFDSKMGLAEYVPDSLEDIVTSLFPRIELHGSKLWCVAEVTLARPITPGEMGELTEWWTGQLSDGWGESLEQHEIRVKDGELYIEPWTSDDDFRIYTQSEFDAHLGIRPEVADIMTTCINGELRPGDLVLSAPTDEYACLVGTVLSINKAGTPEHDAETDNPGDDVHVNFMDSDYSKGRIREIEEMFSNLYEEVKVFDECPIDDTIMEPDMLIHITGIDHEELAAILDSGESAAAYAQKIVTLHETPAQAALHEPDIYDDEATAALRKQLAQRLDENLWTYFDTLRGQDVPGMSSEIAAVTGAHYYLSEIHNFHTSELEYLLQFRDPLSVVANAFEAAGMDDYSDVMWDIFDRQDALQGDYPLMADLSGEETLKQELLRRLDSNLSEYCEGLMDVDKRELIGMAEEIAARYAVRDYLKSYYDFREGDAQYLLGFKHPLAMIANHWPGTGDGLVDMSGVVQDILDDRDDHGRYLKADVPTVPPAEKERQSEKLSVMEQIRQARENPQPHKDTPGRSREPEL